MSSLKARIDLSAFRHNLKSVRKIVGPDAAILPVLKANAYGHSVGPLAREALKFGVPMLGLGTLEEGIELRRFEIAAPILLLDGIFKEELEEAIKYRLTPVVHSMDIARALNRHGLKIGKKLPMHLKFDTGMSRLGINFGEAAEVIPGIKKMRHIDVEGIMTHFASATERDSPQTDLQIRRFDNILKMAREAGLDPKLTHAANSGAIINYPLSHYQMVRPGIMLYGAPPSSVKSISFKPVMTLVSRLISIKNVTGGEGVGYNATYTTPRTKKIGVVMGGYGDGMNRLLSNRAVVTLRGKYLPVVGNICMDNFMVDLSRAPAARVGDEVTLLGGNAVEKTSAGTMAEIAGTIPYEIFCGIGNRVERIIRS
ncbi:MAG: alanine racemase [bacterium]|nr:MAG: alanine racemase [bacterium]